METARRLSWLLGLWAMTAFASVFVPSTAEGGEKPQRIVSLCVPGDQLLLYLVPRERIVALSQFAADPDLSPNYQKATGIPRIRGGVEALTAMQPDLVITSVYSTKSTTDALIKRGVKVVKLNIPNTFDELRAMIRDTARILSEEAKAEALIRDMDARLEQLQARRPPESDWPTAFISFQDHFTIGSYFSFAGTLLETVGCRNIGSQFASGRAVPLETALATRPQLLILARYNEANPISTQRNHTADYFRRLGTEVIPVSMRDIASPDPSNLEFAERLQEKLLPIAAKNQQHQPK